jgi:hypothetical protein
MPDQAFHAQFFHQLEKPLHRTRGFDAHHHRTWQPGVKPAYFIVLVSQDALFHFARFCVQHRQRLLSGMQIAAYNAHLGLLRSGLLLRFGSRNSVLRSFWRPTSLSHQTMRLTISTRSLAARKVPSSDQIEIPCGTRISLPLSTKAQASLENSSQRHANQEA